MFKSIQHEAVTASKWFIRSLKKGDWLWLIILGTVCTAFAFVASVRVMERLSPFTVTVAINLEPIYGIILSLLIFGQAEFMSGAFYLGALLILGAIFTNGIIKARKKRKQHVTPL